MFQEGCERKGVKERVRKRGYGREGMEERVCHGIGVEEGEEDGM